MTYKVSISFINWGVPFRVSTTESFT